MNESKRHKFLFNIGFIGIVRQYINNYCRAISIYISFLGTIIACFDNDLSVDSIHVKRWDIRQRISY